MIERVSMLWLALALVIQPTLADDALLTYKVLSPETALELARATLEDCRRRGYQVSVVVVDRSGTPQVMLRDSLAGVATPETARRKAWTAAAFRSDTLTLAEATVAGTAAAGIRHVNGAIMVGGGVPVEAAGAIVGAVGVSGAPGGKADDDCARAGIEQIEDQVAFGDD